MKKAKVILSIILLFAVAGGALAFKANKNKFTNTAFFVYTSIYVYQGVNYSMGGFYCVWPPIHYVTLSGGVVSTGYFTSQPVYWGIRTGTAVGGATIQITYYSCTTLPFTSTRVTTAS